MKRTFAVAAVSAFLAPAAHAAGALSFEAALQGVRADIQTAREAAREARALNDGYLLRRTQAEVRELADDAERLRWRVSEVRSRARRSPRPSPGGRPEDPFFESDLRRLVWDLRDLKNQAESAERGAQRVEREAEPEPALEYEARRLADEARRLDSAADQLLSEARWARMDLSSAGYNSEAWDVEREAQGAAYAAGRIEQSARRAWDRIRASRS